MALHEMGEAAGSQPEVYTIAQAIADASVRLESPRVLSSADARSVYSIDAVVADGESHMAHLKVSHDTKVGMGAGAGVGLPLAILLAVNGAPELAVAALLLTTALGGIAGRRRGQSSRT